MENFRTAFRGYKKSDVEAAIKENETAVEELRRKNDMLERELSDMRAKLQASEAIVGEQKDEIRRTGENLRSMQRQLEQSLARRAEEMNKHRSDAENLGGLYMKAYEFSRSIAEAPKAHIDSYMTEVEQSSRRAMEELSGAKAGFAETAARIRALVGEISTENERILAHLEKMSGGFDEAGDVYCTVSRVRENFDRTMAELEVKYGDAVQELMKAGTPAEDARSASHAAERVPSADFEADASHRDSLDFFAVPDKTDGDASADTAGGDFASDSSGEDTSFDLAEEDTISDFAGERSLQHHELSLQHHDFAVQHHKLSLQHHDFAVNKSISADVENSYAAGQPDKAEQSDAAGQHEIHIDGGDELSKAEPLDLHDGESAGAEDDFAENMSSKGTDGMDADSKDMAAEESAGDFRIERTSLSDSSDEELERRTANLAARGRNIMQLLNKYQKRGQADEK